jgi:hypothetical protein
VRALPGGAQGATPVQIRNWFLNARRRQSRLDEKLSADPASPVAERISAPS